MESKLLFEKKRTTSGQKALTKSQVLQLLDAITDIEDQALLTLAVYLGIRRSDTVAIERQYINFEEHSLVFYEHKKRAFHKVFMNSKVEQSLQMWMQRSKSKWLFPSHFKKGKHLSSKTAYNILQRNLKKAELPARPFHALRATCIKLHQAAGLLPEQTQRIVNDSLRVIQQHYTTPSDEEMKRAVREANIL
jgi:integrase/recombinase XerD